MQPRTTHRPATQCYLVVGLTALLLTACAQREFFPVSVEEVGLSPAYQLEIRNMTSQTLTIRPLPDFRAEHADKAIEPGQSFRCLVQVKRIRVGETYTREVVAGPYIGSGRLGPDRAYIQYRDEEGLKRDIVIAIGSEAWFAPYTATPAAGAIAPKTITIILTDENMAKTRWFVKGPDAP